MVLHTLVLCFLFLNPLVTFISLTPLSISSIMYFVISSILSVLMNNIFESLIPVRNVSIILLSIYLIISDIKSASIPKMNVPITKTVPFTIKSDVPKVKPNFY